MSPVREQNVALGVAKYAGSGPIGGILGGAIFFALDSFQPTTELFAKPLNTTRRTFEHSTESRLVVVHGRIKLG